MKFRSLILFSVVFILTIYAPVQSLRQHGIRAPFSYMAGDAFYYLAVADHSVDKPFYTFDRLHPTNGFHPLWQYFITLSFKFFHLSNPENQILYVFWVCIILTALAFAFFSACLLKLTQNSALAFFGSMPGPFYLFYIALNPHYGSPWSFINGMESSFSILCFAFILFFLIHTKFYYNITNSNIFLASAILSILVLCRLDDIFIFIPFLFFLCWTSPRNNLIQRVLIAVIPPLLFIGSYLFYNYVSTGMTLPVNGTAKARLTLVNFYYLFNVFFPHNSDIWSETSWRIMQLVVPPLIALMWLKKHWDEQKYESRIPLMSINLLCIYVILKALYNFLCVDLWAQGHWYFPLSILIANLIVVLFIGSYVKSSGLLTFLTAILWALVLANRFIEIKADFIPPSFKFWQEREKITQSIKHVYSGTGLVEISDGIFSYASEIPTMSGLGFALDKQSFHAKMHGDFLHCAYERGFHALAAINHYINPGRDIVNDQQKFRDYIKNRFFLRQEKMELWKFKIILQDENTGITLVEFLPL
jgi:hypothetical protein